MAKKKRPQTPQTPNRPKLSCSTTAMGAGAVDMGFLWDN
jgi:hypothetical protein